MTDQQHPQELIDAVAREKATGGYPVAWDESYLSELVASIVRDQSHEIHATITAIDQYRREHSTTTPNVSDEALFAIFRAAYKAEAISPKMDRIFEEDYDWAVALCDRAGVVAVRAALAIASASGEEGT